MGDLELRNYFAGKILTSIVAFGLVWEQDGLEKIAKNCYWLADVMVKTSKGG